MCVGGGGRVVNYFTLTQHWMQEPGGAGQLSSTLPPTHILSGENPAQGNKRGGGGMAMVGGVTGPLPTAGYRLGQAFA